MLQRVTSQTVTVAQALTSSSSGLMVVDSAAHIAGALPDTSLTNRVASFTVNGAAMLSASQLLLLAGLGSKLHATPGELALAGTATLSAAQLTLLEGMPGFTIAGSAHVTLSDNPANISNLITNHLNWLAHVSAITIGLNGTAMNGAAAAELVALEEAGKQVNFVVASGHAVLNVAASIQSLAANEAALNTLSSQQALSFTVTGGASDISAGNALALTALHGFSIAAQSLAIIDTGAALSQAASSLFGQGFAQITVASGQFAGTAAQLLDPSLHFAAGASAQLAASVTTSAASAVALEALPGFSHAAGAVLTISDTAANLALLTHAQAALAGSIDLAGNASVTVAQFAALRALPHFALAGHRLAIADSASNLLGLTSAQASLAAGISLSGNATVSAASYLALAALPGFSTGGFVLDIADSATNLLTLSGLTLIGVSAVCLSADATVNAQQAEALAGEANFSTGGHSLTISDSAAKLLTLGSAQAALASAVTLSGNANVTAAAFTALCALPHFSLGAHSLAIADTAANLLGLTGNLSLASSCTLSANAQVTVAQLQTLASEPGFSSGGHSLIIADTALDLLGLTTAQAALCSEVTLSQAASITASQYMALTGIANFSPGGTTLAIADSAANLLTLAGDPLTGVSAVSLSADASVTVAQFAALEALPNFALAGHTLIIADTAGNLAGLSQAEAALATAVVLTQDSTVSVASYQMLAALPGFGTGGHVLAISDSAANLLALAGDTLTGVSFVSLSGNATVTAQQAQALASEPDFSTGGHSLSISDGPSALLALPTSLIIAASALDLAAASQVSAQQLTELAALGSKFSTGGHALICADSATALAGLPSLAVALASATVLTSSAVVNAATLATLAGLPDFSVQSPATLVVQDSAANLIALGQTGAADITAAELVPGSVVTLPAAQAAALSLVPHFSAAGSTITVSGSIAELTASTGWAGIASHVAIIDSAANLAAAAGSALVQNAASVTLSGNAEVSAGVVAELQSIPGFSSGSYQLTVADSAANIAGNEAAIAALAGSAQVDASATINTANANTLALLSAAGKLGFAGGAHLTITDSIANLLNGSNSAGLALASSVTPDANETVTVSQFTQLRGLAHFALGGMQLTIADSASALLTLAGSNLALASAIEISADATLSAAAAASLTGEAGYTADSSHLTIADTAAALAALAAPVIAFASAAQVTVSATINAATAASLAGLPNLTEASGVTLTLQDSVSNLLALSAQARAVAGSVELTPGSVVTLDVAQAAQLAAIPHFSSAGATITVSGTLADLAAHATSAWTTIDHSYIIVDSAADIAAAANTPLLAGAASVTLSGAATIGAATAASLAGIDNFSPGGNAVAVADSAANLIANAASVEALATSVSVTDSETLSVAQAVTLAQIAAAAGSGFSLGGHSQTIADTASNLLSLTPSQAALAGSIALSADATVNAAAFASLRGLPNFALNGHSLAISDTAANLLGLTGSLALAGTISLSANASLTAPQFASLIEIPGFSYAGHTVSITGTAAQLLGLGIDDLSQVSSVTLSANATVSAAQALSLTGEPGFSTGTAALTISDSAENLLALPNGLKAIATSLTLAAPETVSASVLTALLGLGSSFTEAGHRLTVADSAANLTSLSAGALALAGAEQLNVSSVVNASMAASLAALPNFGLAQGVTLTVQDSAQNLIALGGGAPSGTGLEQLSAGNTSPSLTAHQAAELAALPHFSASNASITVSDSIANLTTSANTGWQNVAAITNVVDSAATLAANESTALVQDAHAVTLSGNATVSAQTANLLSLIPGFSTGAYSLTVSDTASDIAQYADAINAIATTAIVTGSGPVNADTADELALVSNAGKLSFSGGNQLIVQDSYANLTSNANLAGLALAHGITVLDTASDLIAASSHDWGGIVPSYVLSQGGDIDAAQATELAGLGARYSNGGATLSVADSAANVVAASSAIAALGLLATVSDSASDIGAQVAGLVSLGGNLSAIDITDTGAVLAVTAASLSPLGAKLAGNTVLVSDSAANVNSQTSALAALGSHVAISVSDTAADLAQYVSNFLLLGDTLTLTLTDSQPVSATTAAALAPLVAELSAGSVLNVSDSEGAIAGYALQLAALGTHLGTITLGSTTMGANDAAAIAPLVSHLAQGVTISISDNADNMANSLTALQNLQQEGRLGTVTDNNGQVSDLAPAGNMAALNALDAAVTIDDTAAHVQAALSTLAQLRNLQSITLADDGNQAISLSFSALQSYSAVLAKIGTPYELSVSGTAQQIAADIAQGSAGLLYEFAGVLHGLTITGGAPLVLSQAAALASGVNDSGHAILAAFSGTLDVTGVDVAHVAAVASGTHMPSGIAVVDTGGAIAANLAQGAGSSLLAALSQISGITASDSANVSLTAAQALYAGVDDSAGSAIALLHDASLVVTDASIGQLAGLATLHVAPAAISVNDTAANIEADIAGGESLLISGLAHITTIEVSDGLPITLTESELLAPGVDDGPDSVLSEITNSSLDVTGVAAGDIPEILGLPVAPSSITVSDSAANLASDLATLVTDIGKIQSIADSSGTLTLTADQALEAGVDSNGLSVIGRLSGHVFDVTGADIAQLGQIMALAYTPATITVSASASSILSDLTGGNSILAANASHLGTITVTGGTLALTDAQADAIIASNALDSVMGKLAGATMVTVSGVPLADLTTLAASGWPNLSLAVTDTATAISLNLNADPSTLSSESAEIGSVTLTAGGTVNAATLAAMAALPGFSTGGFTLTVADGAQAIAGLGHAALALAPVVDVTDTGANVATYLAQLHTKYGGGLSITLSGGSPSMSIAAATYAAYQQTIDTITNTGHVTVTDSVAQLAPILAQLASDPEIGQVVVSDTAANIVADLSALEAVGAKLEIALTDTTIGANVVAPLLAAGVTLSGLAVVDTGSAIAAAVETGGTAVIQYMETNGTTLSGDGAVTAEAAQVLEGLTGFSTGSHHLYIWDTAAHLSNSAYSAILASGDISGIYLKTTGGSVTVTAAQAATLFGLPNFSTSNYGGGANLVNITDSAANLLANVAALEEVRNELGTITITGAASVTTNQLEELQSLGAALASGASIAVSDTAGALASYAALLAESPPSLNAGSFSLSQSGSLSVAQALQIASLPNFTANGHTLTLQAQAQASISVANANLLGTLGSTLHLNGDVLTLAGTVSQLTGLTAAGSNVAQVELADSLANIAALSSSSPLLAGTVEITGSGATTASQLASLLALISTGGPGIASASLTIDQPRDVFGSVAALQSLTASAGWTANATLHADFPLYATDTVANLIAPANTSFLSGIASSLLSANCIVQAQAASSLAAIANAIHFQAGGYTITVQDSAANLLNASYGAGLALANTVELNGAATVNAAQAIALLDISHFTLSAATPLTIEDNSADLLQSGLATAITTSGLASHITVTLAAPETLDADTAETLVSIPGFTDTHDLTIADDASYLLNTANLTAETAAVSVTLAGDEIVSANEILRLSEVPHFTPGSSELILASNDFADAPTLKAIADFGAAFDHNGNSITLTGDVLNLSPTEYIALQSDDVVQNGHELGIVPTAVSLTDADNILTIAGTGVAGGTVKIYAADGSQISSSYEVTGGFTVTAQDMGPGNNFAVTETMEATGTEGAPLVILDAGSVETAVAALGGNFASTGAIQVDSGKFINLYEAGSVPQNLSNAALVYDPTAHTISLDVPGHSMVTLITLGGTTHPTTLEATEILFKTHG